MEKYYAFRDLNKDGSFEEVSEFHAYGIVESFYEDPEKPSVSQKDMVVIYFNPFTGNFDRCWRGFNKVELFEIEKWTYEMLKKRYEKLDQLRSTCDWCNQKNNYE